MAALECVFCRYERDREDHETQGVHNTPKEGCRTRNRPYPGRLRQEGIVVNAELEQSPPVLIELRHDLLHLRRMSPQEL